MDAIADEADLSACKILVENCVQLTAQDLKRAHHLLRARTEGNIGSLRKR